MPPPKAAAPDSAFAAPVAMFLMLASFESLTVTYQSTEFT